MAGLFDFLMQQQGQQGGGLLGNVGGWFNNNQDALVAMGLGMAGGATPMEGFKGGMQGYLSGRKSDQSRTAGEQFIKEMGLGVAPSAGPFSKPSPALGPAPGMPQAAPQGMPQFAPVNPMAPRVIERGPQGQPVYDAKFASPFESDVPPVAGLDPAHRDMLIRTVLGEAANQPPEGQAAVAAVVRNRMQAGRYGGTDVPSVVQAKGQFEPWGNPEARAGMLAYSPQDPKYQQVGQIVDQVISGQMPDPTGGATHFFAPRAQAALGRQPPAWAQGQGQQIGGHTFYAPEGRVQVAQAGGGPIPMGGAPQPGAPVPMAGAQPGAVQPVAQDQLGAIRNLPLMTVMKWAMNDNLPAAQKEVAQKIFAARLEDTKMTEKQKDYLWAQAGGFKGSRADFLNPPKLEETGQRDQYGRPMPKAWVNPNDQSIKPIGAAGSSGLSGAGNANPPIELVTDLRKQVQAIPSYKNLTEAAPIYRSMLATAGTDSKASDLNLVYGLGKIMDPGSVVREGEMVMVKRTASLPDWLVGSINALNGGAALTPDTRKAILAEAHNRVTAYKGEFDRDSAQYRGIVNDYGIKPSHVLPDFGEFPEYVSQKTTAPPGASMPTPPPRPIVPAPKTGDWQDYGTGKIRLKQQ